MDKKFVVVGAGMAGLLAAGILRDRCAGIFEAAPSLPNNHNALLRFRSTVVGDTLGIKFKEVTAFKGVASMGRGPIADALSYSRKATGFATMRSISENLNVPLKRYIAPPDLISRMHDKIQCKIAFSEKLNQRDFRELKEKYHIISTTPMPTLESIFNFEFLFESQFRHSNGFVLTATLPNVEAYATMYFPSLTKKFYRASITGDQLILEYSGLEYFKEVAKNPITQIAKALRHFGLPSCSREQEVKKQRYSKILPISESERLRFMINMTDNHGIYSLGRFATWRPGLLLDDVVNDVHRIVDMAESGINHQKIKRNKPHA